MVSAITSGKVGSVAVSRPAKGAGIPAGNNDTEVFIPEHGLSLPVLAKRYAKDGIKPTGAMISLKNSPNWCLR